MNGNKARNALIAAAFVFMGVLAAVTFIPSASYAEAIRTIGVLFKGGLTIGTSGTKIDDSYAGSGAYDFPAMSNVCEDSFAITVTGAALGDPCIVSAGASSGADAYNASFTCYVSAANAVKVRACAPGYDAGTVNLPDASYSVRVFDP